VEVQGAREQVQDQIIWVGGGQTDGVLVRPIAHYSDRSDDTRRCARVLDLTHGGYPLGLSS
jgi:hypothetical protein